MYRRFRGTYCTLYSYDVGRNLLRVSLNIYRNSRRHNPQDYDIRTETGVCLYSKVAKYKGCLCRMLITVRQTPRWPQHLLLQQSQMSSCPSWPPATLLPLWLYVLFCPFPVHRKEEPSTALSVSLSLALPQKQYIYAFLFPSLLPLLLLLAYIKHLLAKRLKRYANPQCSKV